MYCVIQSRNSDAWARNFKHNEKNFPRDVARALLDCDNITQTKVVNFLGNNAGYENLLSKKKTKSNAETKSRLYEKLAVLKGLTLIRPGVGGGWGWNLPTATLTACRYVPDGVRTVKPSCNFHFWCLKSFEEKKFRLRIF